MKSRTWTFDIYLPPDYAAGFYETRDTISIRVESGDPGGNSGDFVGFLKEVLSQWYEGAEIKLRRPKQRKKR